MSVAFIGDIHGRPQWKNIAADEYVFVGDYVSTHERISEGDQISNLLEILQFKEDNPGRVTLLRGNHDLQHLGYHWADCSGYFPKVAKEMIPMRGRFLSDTCWIWRRGNILASHAGISNTWLRNSGLTLESINDAPPSELFAFTPDHWGDDYGASVTQPPVWIRPTSLVEDALEGGYTQIVGHTPYGKIVNLGKTFDLPIGIWLIDNMPEHYLLLTDDGDLVVTSV